MPLNEAPNRDPADTGLARTSASRPRLGAADLIVQFWRAKWLMLLVFVPVFALGLAAALSRPDQFESRSRLIVSSVSGASHDDLVLRSTSPVRPGAAPCAAMPKGFAASPQSVAR
mgnify:CR=1 FL=1